MADGVTVYRLASEFDKEYPREPSERLAARAVQSLTDVERVAILTGLLSSEIESIRRSRARQVEHRAWDEARNHRLKEAQDSDPRLIAERKRRAEARRMEEAEQAALWESDPDEYRRRYTLGGILQGFEEQVRGNERQKVTAELLSVVFATGDGKRVTWGEATLEDHRKRIELLTQNIKGNVQTIRLHEYAAEILRKTGAPNLNRSKAITFA